MYAVMIEYGDRFFSKNCVSLVDCIRFIADVIFKEGEEQPSKIWIDKEESVM